MSVDEIIRAATIMFPVPLEKDDVDHLFGYLAETMQARVCYATSYVTDINHRDSPDPNPKKRMSSLEISGNISLAKAPFTSDSFSSKGLYDACDSQVPLEEQDSDEVSIPQIPGIRFCLTPGFKNLESYDNDRRELWQVVREHVKQYFEHMPQKTVCIPPE